MIQATPSMPTAASTIDTGVTTPAPLPVAEKPAIVGMKKVAEKTGPMKPTACATTSSSRRLPLPSFAGSGPSLVATVPPLVDAGAAARRSPGHSVRQPAAGLLPGPPASLDVECRNDRRSAGADGADRA